MVKPTPRSRLENPWARVRPPAKLNLFLELLDRRKDGYHEIDTVMVPIDWCDQMDIRRSDEPGVRLQVAWLPSSQIGGRRLGIDVGSMQVRGDQSNLVHRALVRFAESMGVTGGFECHLLKSIPAGAGMGGASSDAAAALDCAARLCDFETGTDRLHQIAAELGSDVPFFLGIDGRPVTAARAGGRGERLSPISLACPLDVVVVFPGESLSTARVYGAAKVPECPRSADGLIGALESGNRDKIGSELMNRLAEPAQEIAPRIAEILKSMWRAGLRTCQLTGSGSACFAIAGSAREARRAAARLRAESEPGALVVATRTIRVPPLVKMG